MDPGSDWTALLARRIDRPAPMAPPQHAPAPEPLAQEGPRGAFGFGFVVLPRHGRRPLGFQGRMLACVEAAPPDLPVASAVELHEAEAGGFVCAIRHRLRPPLEEDLRCYATFAPDAMAVLRFLHAHDPLRDLPVAALLPPEDRLEEPGALAAAAALAPRLRGVWRELLAASFGPSPAAGESRAEAPG
jgi:hypothetical protein